MAPSLLREVWNYGRDDHSWNRLIFWKSVARLNSDEVLEQLWKRSLDRDPIEDERFEAVSALATLEPEEAVVHLAGWQGPGFLEADLQRMATEDPDDDIQWECLQALDRQNKEHCVLELMDAFRGADGTTRGAT